MYCKELNDYYAEQQMLQADLTEASIEGIIHQYVVENGMSRQAVIRAFATYVEQAENSGRPDIETFLYQYVQG